MKYLIRHAKREDCYGIAHVVSVSWNETYKKIVPESFLKELRENEEENAKRILDNFEKNGLKELVLEINDTIVGFVRYGKALDQNLDNCGEIVAIYIIKKYHGYGFGKELFEKAKEELKKQGFNKMVISCLKGNPTNDFYKHMGGKYLKDGLFERLQLKENIYYYDI